MSFIDDSIKNVKRQLMKEVSGGGIAGFTGRAGRDIDALFAGAYHPDSGHGRPPPSDRSCAGTCGIRPESDFDPRAAIPISAVWVPCFLGVVQAWGTSGNSGS